MSNSKKKSLSGNAVQKNPGKEQSASSIRKWMGIIPLLILTYLAYTPALKNSITGWDDNNYITENKDIRQLNTDFIKKSFAPHSGYVMGNYHPLTMISYALEYKSGKLNPKTFHTTNVLLHLINGALVYLFIWLLSGRMLVRSITSGSSSALVYSSWRYLAKPWPLQWSLSSPCLIIISTESSPVQKLFSKKFPF